MTSPFASSPAYRNSDLPPRHAPHPQTPRESPEAPAADLRSQAVSRLHIMNIRHGDAAWQRRRRDPLAPYALAFLFAWPDPNRPHRSTLAAATRMWLAGPETEHLPHLLFDLDRHARELLNNRGGDAVDVRDALANRADPMPEHAEYVGVGLSSLDTHTGTWQQVCQRGEGQINLPGRALIVLNNGSLIACERRGVKEFNDFHVTCNRSMEIAADRTLFPCSWATPEELRGAEPETWRFLEQLNNTLTHVDQTRRSTVVIDLNARIGRREGNRGR